MTATQIGSYVLLLSYQWANGSIPDNPDEIRRIARIPRKSWDKVWSVLQQKFPIADGNRVNPRMAADREKAIRELKTRRENGKFGKLGCAPTRVPRRVPQVGTQEGTHIGRGKREDSNTKKKRQTIPPDPDEVRSWWRDQGFERDVEEFLDHYTANGWRVSGKSPMKDWQAAARNWQRRKFPGGAGQPPTGPVSF